MDEQKSVDDIVSELISDIPTNAELSVDLPSGRVAQIKPITFEEEKQMVMLSKKNEDPTEVLFSKCVSNLDLEDLLIVDKIYLLFKIRELSFGSTYKFIMGCPACGHENHYSIDINKLPVARLDDPTGELFELPMSKKKVKVSYATINDEKYVTDSGSLLDNLWRFVKEFEGQTRKDVVSKVLKHLSAGDINTIIAKVMCKGYGIQSEVRVKCNSCSYDQPSELPLTQDFFSVT